LFVASIFKKEVLSSVKKAAKTSLVASGEECLQLAYFWAGSKKLCTLLLSCEKNLLPQSITSKFEFYFFEHLLGALV
jgi:hypothetical protein